MNAPEPQRQLFNPAQKNALRVSLLLLEKGMLEVDRLLAAGEHHGVLFRIVDDLGQNTKTSVSRLVHDVRGVIRELQARFQLDMELEGKSRAIFGKVPLLWEMVTDTDARRLRGYGEVDPTVETLLNPSIEHLSRLLLQMHQLVSKSDEGTVVG
jgi:hypothetical protein